MDDSLGCFRVERLLYSRAKQRIELSSRSDIVHRISADIPGMLAKAAATVGAHADGRLTRLPKSPEKMPMPMKTVTNLMPASVFSVNVHVLFSDIRTSRAASAIMAPPAPLTNVPQAVIPPCKSSVSKSGQLNNNVEELKLTLVPGGTGRPDVIRIGFVFASIPSCTKVYIILISQARFGNLIYLAGQGISHTCGPEADKQLC